MDRTHTLLEKKQLTEQEYEYRGLLAESWDLFRGDTSEWPDRPFFRDIIQDNGQPALDVGCSTGRLILDYMAAGLDVDGVDVSPDMLAICRQKARSLGLQPNLYLQAMETLDLPRSYGTIFVSSSSFQVVTDLSDAREALKRFYSHLRPGGILVMSFMLFEPDDEALQEQEWFLIGEDTRPEDGLLLRRWWRGSYDAPTQLQHTEERFELLDGDEVVTEEYQRRSPATRGYTQMQILEHLADAGFEDVHAVSNFTNEPAGPEDGTFCVFGTRPMA
jgi:SAM-dependent methyltransferase